MENLDFIKEQNNRKVFENKVPKENLRGKIIYNFRDGSVGVFDTIEELTEAIKTERENYN